MTTESNKLSPAAGDLPVAVFFTTPNGVRFQNPGQAKCALQSRSTTLEILCEERGRIERLQARFPADRHGNAIDWPAELRRAAESYLRLSSINALRVLTRPSGRFEPKPDLMGLLGDRAHQAAHQIPTLRARIDPAPLPRNLYNRLLDSKKGGLGRFNMLRNKSAHWLAPVPGALALELRQYYCRVLTELVPLAVELWRPDGDHRLEQWSRKVLAAARGEPVEACEPLGYQRLRELVADGRSLTT